MSVTLQPGGQPKIVVALLFGGRSSEHEISCVTAGAVLSAIDRTRFAVVPIGITKEGKFVLQKDDPAALALDPSAMPQVSDNGPEVLWPAHNGSRMFRAIEADNRIADLAEIDVVFPLLHGRWGEDGTLQGLIELFGIPYVGDGVLASSVSMDKAFTKTVLSAADIQVSPSVTVTRWQWDADQAAVRGRANDLGLPLFVKPARAGSSVGVSKVTSLDGLGDALEAAFGEDAKVLIEKAVVGREVECGVLGGHDHAAPRISVAGEITVSGRDFYDYEAKYLDESSTTLSVPADLSDEQLAQMQRIAADAFVALDGAGLARVDFFLTESGFVVNEVNTMPGFTPVSMFPRVWQASGLTYSELLTDLIELALER